MHSNLFDRSAGDFAANADALLSAGKYERGRLFVAAVRRVVRPGGRILDYSCGPGRISYLLAGAGYEVTGTDPSVGMIEQAKRRLPAGVHIQFEVATDGGRSLQTGIYDGIVCSSVIEYVPDAPGLLREFCRALRPGGALALSFANRDSLWRRYSVWRFGRALPHLSLQHNIWTLRDCVASLVQAGFEVTGPPQYFDCAPFDRRPSLAFLSAWSRIGTLGLVVARASGPLDTAAASAP